MACADNFVSSDVWFQRYASGQTNIHTYIQTDRQTDTFIAILFTLAGRSNDRITSHILIFIKMSSYIINCNIFKHKTLI